MPNSFPWLVNAALTGILTLLEQQSPFGNCSWPPVAPPSQRIVSSAISPVLICTLVGSPWGAAAVSVHNTPTVLPELMTVNPSPNAAAVAATGGEAMLFQLMPSMLDE